MNKICNFYINDTHLNIALCGYIRKQVSCGTKVIVISQDNTKMKIKDIKSKFKNNNIKEDIDFLSEEKINSLYKNEKITIIIKGDNNFILKMEESLTELFKDESIDILSCYDINNINVNKIHSKYNQILNTNGIYDLEKNENNNLQKI